MLTEQQEMRDFRKIRFSGRKLRANDCLAMHYMDRMWLERELATEHNGPPVVITRRGVDPRPPHEAVDDQVGATCVICNPQHPGEGTGFRADLVVK